jgi:hypothetical protein
MQNSTTSTVPSDAGSSVATMPPTVRSHCAPAIVSPLRRSAARWGPRAMKATSWPDEASMPPK